MPSLLARLVRPRPRADHLRFTVYTRRDCGCCEAAFDLLGPYQRRHKFVIEAVDVDTDPELVALHGLSVPVVAIDGKVRFRGKINRVLLERLLFAEARLVLFLALGATTLFAPFASGDEPLDASKVVLVIHGGAGPLAKAEMTPELEKGYRGDLEASLKAGHAVLRDGGEGVDAVVAAIKVLEDSPRFNAGKGAVFTHDGRNELDASIMDGGTGKAGAVAGVTTVKNPITAALAVMRKSKHVMMISKGADRFAEEQGLEIVDPSYFRTEKRWEELQRALKKEREAQSRVGDDPPRYLGTVGAVALDHRGHLAAGTSTGGMTNKRFGRVGDSPIIGAGCFAEDASCAVSATGHGEYFIRHVVAYDIAARVKYKGQSVREAADAVIHGVLTPDAGEGGVIVLDTKGRWTAPFNSEGMYRGTITEGGAVRIAIYEDQDL